MPKKGFKHTEETKKKISESEKGKIVLKETKKKISKSKKRWWEENKDNEKVEIRNKKISLASKGKKKKPFTNKHKKNISLAHKGQKAWNKNKKIGSPSKETREKISKKLKGRKKSKKTIKKLKIARAKQVLPFKDSSPEVKIQNFLKTLGIEFFTHQYMKEIKHAYQCDILIPSMNLVIECDGDFIHCNPARYSPDFVRYPNSKDNQPAYVIWERDRLRTKELIEKGFKVLRLWEFEINEMSIKEFKNKIKIDWQNG